MAILNMSQYHFCRLFKRFASGQHFVNDGCIAASPKQERPNLPQDSPRQATGVLTAETLRSCINLCVFCTSNLQFSRF